MKRDGLRSEIREIDFFECEREIELTGTELVFVRLGLRFFSEWGEFDKAQNKTQVSCFQKPSDTEVLIGNISFSMR